MALTIVSSPGADLQAAVMPGVQEEIEDSFRDLFPKCQGRVLHMSDILCAIIYLPRLDARARSRSHD